jgi:hypothetical protein
VLGERDELEERRLQLGGRGGKEEGAAEGDLFGAGKNEVSGVLQLERGRRRDAKQAYGGNIGKH